MRGGTLIQIGDLSKRTGVSIRSLRYYEEKQVLTPARSENGYHREEHVEQVMQIQLYLGLGLKVEEIANILDGIPVEQKKNTAGNTRSLCMNIS